MGAHSIGSESLGPEDPTDGGLKASQVNVTTDLLDTGVEFATLTGWAGTESDVERTILLHMTGSHHHYPIENKRLLLLSLFNTSTQGGKEALAEAAREALLRL